MLTRQGWLAALGAVALAVGGRTLGLPELYVLAAVTWALLIACLAAVHLSRLDLEVVRTVQPARIHVGTGGRIELRVRNRRPAHTPVLRLRDPVTGTRGADLLLAPMRGGATTTAAYRLPTSRRGLLEVGPLEVEVSDPFGLARVGTRAAPKVEVVVYPHVDEIRPLPYTTGHDPLAGVRQPNSLGRIGEDFYALRPYVVGDDLRRVHWPSTARHGDLMVRQNELPWQARTTVLLDVRSGACPGDALEVATSVAASIVSASARRRDLVRLLDTAGADTGYGTGFGHTEAILEHLAMVARAPGANLRRTLESLARRSSGGALVAIVAAVPEDDLRAIAGLRGRFGSLTVVQVDRSAWDRSAAAPASAVERPGAPSGGGGRFGGPVVEVTAATPFPVAWGDHLARARARRAPAALGVDR